MGVGCKIYFYVVVVQLVVGVLVFVVGFEFVIVYGFGQVVDVFIVVVV